MSKAGTGLIAIFSTLLLFGSACSSSGERGACPACGSSRDVVKIAYGLPTAEGFEAEERGEVHFGGCDLEEGAPKFYCKKDSLEF